MAKCMLGRMLLSLARSKFVSWTSARDKIIRRTDFLAGIQKYLSVLLLSSEGRVGKQSNNAAAKFLQNNFVSRVVQAETCS